MAVSSQPDHTGQQQQDDLTRDGDREQPSETSPLLARDEVEHNDQSQPHRYLSAASLLRAFQGSKNSRRRWPSLVALLLLCVLAAAIIVLAFVAPSVVEAYASQAVDFEPTSLSIDSFLDTGVRARVQGTFRMDASRVRRKSIRDLGKFCTWIATEVETGESIVEVSLPEYGNVLLGTAHVPPIKVYIRDGHGTAVDFLTDLQPGDVAGLRRIANDWIDGRLGQLRVVGKASVPIKSGLLNLGKQTVQHEMLFANDDLPSIPAYDIKKLNIREVDIPSGKGMAADVSLMLQNDFPVDLTVPTLGFGVLVDNCEKSDDLIMIADATTHEIHVQPKTEVEVNATGTVRQLPSVLLQDCPGTRNSPLDKLLAKYLHGIENTVYVRGSDSPSSDTPRWITELMADIIVPVPVPGRTFGHLIKNFTFADTHFSLPDPWAEPNTPESNPRISAKVRTLIALPEEMNFNLSVVKVKADADVFYKGKKLGHLDLSEWQDANSTRIEATPDEGPALMVESSVREAPLEIEDEDVFTDVIQQVIFGKKTVVLKVKAEVDVGVDTALGELTIRRIPAEGEVPVKLTLPPNGPPSIPGKPPALGNLTDSFKPKIVDLRIINTTETALAIGAKINITNPTPYAATVPYIDIHVLKNGSLLGHVTARNLEVVPGNNSNLEVEAIYAPLDLGGAHAQAIGRELLSQYISGWNTTLTIQMHEHSFPSNPSLGRALAHFPLDVAAPRLGSQQPPSSDPSDPSDDDEDRAHFIQDATMHLFSSTATFLLLSPLRHSTLYITSLHATALYHSQPAGVISYETEFPVPPLALTPGHRGALTPRLPVDWSLGSVGYEAVRSALGGTLRLSAEAKVGVRVGRWRERVWFKGRSIGAKVRL